ncbi:MAG: ABC transporter ATP-binding protein/permease [Acidimicrobiales bacterium]
MKAGLGGSPLPWLGGLLAAYLALPLLLFLARIPGSGQRGFGVPGLWAALGTSVESATVSTGIIAVLGVPLAFGLARARGPLAAVAGVAVQLPLAIPPVMSGIVLVYVVGPYTAIGRLFGGRLTGTVAAIVLAQTFVSAPFLIIAARSAFAALDPALDELAATLGHHPLSRFWRVALPLAAPGIRAGLLLTWLRAFGEYGATVVLAYHPYSLPVFSYIQFSGAGIPTTQAPTVLAVMAALGAVLVAAGTARIHAARRQQRPVRLPAPSAPRPGQSRRVGFDLDVRAGTFNLQLTHQATRPQLAILGPSGSGKSMTLRALAGLLGTGVGRVSLDGTAIDTLSPEVRTIGYVPQGLVLFPHLPVWPQVTFGVGADPAVAAWWMETLGLTELAGRLPRELSGGQRQRVSLAQALSRQPELLLLDEPFSALDAPVRSELRLELRRLQREAGLSTVLVTHDPEEAALLADEVMVVGAGRILQAGTRSDLYRHPASAEVARLLGIHNISSATVSGPGRIRAGAVTLAADTGGLATGAPVSWALRPEQIRISDRGAHPARVLDVIDLGAVTDLSLELEGGLRLRARHVDETGFEPGADCRLDLPAAAITVWPAGS